MREWNAGGYLLRVRRVRMWTQGDLAEEAGVSPTTVSGIESGKISRPHFGTLRKLAQVLEVDPRDFFDPEPVEPRGGASWTLTLAWARSTRDTEFERGLERVSLEELKRLSRELAEECARLKEVYGGLPPESEERLYVKGEIRHVAARSESVTTSILFHPEKE